ncbi:hypothetical protein [Rubellicoccus peritrichatus]|uniref:HTH gntR-type domain-containing protein n=1 Tax=Rubellicoccus peritrichatus TaxID=3080537 RepID=A0AAQ3L777_9BACT|nr:hypothetical protein [Puniceicoccus sp. CR14]WOO40286.1 hypothetical protein RZN69_16830 [Puniceicoccus sp. CR14]
MPKKPTKRILEVKQSLLDKIADRNSRQRNFFISNRELSLRYGVSYQTAHRLLKQLADEGHLHRAKASGTYLAGSDQSFDGITLFMDPLSKKKNSFGFQILSEFRKQLAERSISFEVSYCKRFRKFPENRYPVIWGVDLDLRTFNSHVNYCTVLNQEVHAGLNAIFTDCIELGQLEGAEKLGRYVWEYYGINNPVIIAGPKFNKVIRERVEGFKNAWPKCETIFSEDSTLEECRKAVIRARRYNFDAILSTNEEITSVVLKGIGRRKPIVSFGSKEFLEKNRLEGLFVPVEEIVERSMEIYIKRCTLNCEAGMNYKLQPCPVNLRGYGWSNESIDQYALSA